MALRHRGHHLMLWLSPALLAAAMMVGAGADTPRRAIRPMLLDNRINVNEADEATLQLLPGVGPRLAQGIIEHREAHGPFESVGQLDDVSRIGPITLRNLRPWVTVVELRSAGGTP